MNSVSRATFKDYSTDSKLDTIFDYIGEIHGTLDCREKTRAEQQQICYDRMDKIEAGIKKWKFFSSTTAFFGGIVGGIIAVITKTLWGK